MQINREITIPPFLKQVGKEIVKFWVGSHKLKTETGSWKRTPHAARICGTWCELGDEHDILYNCCEIYCDYLEDMRGEIASLWEVLASSNFIKWSENYDMSTESIVDEWFMNEYFFQISLAHKSVFANVESMIFSRRT